MDLPAQLVDGTGLAESVRSAITEDEIATVVSLRSSCRLAPRWIPGISVDLFLQ